MKRKFIHVAYQPMRIIATCMIAGPLIGVVALYLAFLGVFVWVGLSQFLSSVPTKGGAIAGMLLGTLFLLLPVFAVVGAVVVALQTFLTGTALSVIDTLKVPEKIVGLLPVLPLAPVRFAIAFLAGLAVSFAVSPIEAPKQFTNLGPLSLQLAAAVAAGICYLIALRWAANQRPHSSPLQVARDGA